jgi:hypothetical protein
VRALGQHLILRLWDNRVVAQTPEERRIVASSVLRLAKNDELLSFGIPDTHLHMNTADQERAAGQLARRVEISLRQRLRLDVRFTPARPEPILDQRHLGNAFWYVLRQNERHELDWDPYHEASNLPDLLGLRVLGRYTWGNVQRWLPRVKRRELLACLGVEELVPADGPPDQVLPAAIRAAGVPRLEGYSVTTNQIRRVVVEIVGHRVPWTELAASLRVNRRTLYRMAELPVNQRLLAATRLQLGLARALEKRHGGEDAASERPPQETGTGRLRSASGRR